jgi:tetratricopeptide (TPR) repeat protein
MNNSNGGAFVALLWIVTIVISIGSGILVWNWIEPENFFGAIVFLILWGILSKIWHFLAMEFVTLFATEKYKNHNNMKAYFIFSIALLISCSNPNTNKAKAIKFFENNNYEQALVEINKAIETEPDSVSHYSLRVMIYDLTGRYKEELSDLNKIIDLNNRYNDSKSLNVHHQRAVIEIDLGLYKDALSDINYFIENKDTIGSLSEAYINKASILYKLDDYENSHKYYELALKENNGENNSIESMALIGLANLSTSMQEALSYLDKVISLDDKNAMAYGSRGAIYIELGKIKEAYSDCKKAISLNPDDATVNFNFGQLHANYLNNSDSAIYYFEKAINLSPQSPNNDEVYMNMAVLKHNKGKLDEALHDFKKAESFNANNDILLYNFAMLLSDLGKNKEALDKISKAIDINSKDETYFNLKGSILIDMSLFNDASKEFFKAIEINQNYGGAYYNLGYLYGKLNNCALSIRYYNKAVQLNFDLEATLVNLALQKIKNNEISSACADLERAYRLGRTDIEPLINEYCK